MQLARQPQQVRKPRFVWPGPRASAGARKSAGVACGPLRHARTSQVARAAELVRISSEQAAPAVVRISSEQASAPVVRISSMQENSVFGRPPPDEVRVLHAGGPAFRLSPAQRAQLAQLARAQPYSVPKPGARCIGIRHASAERLAAAGLPPNLLAPPADQPQPAPPADQPQPSASAGQGAAPRPPRFALNSLAYELDLTWGEVAMHGEEHVVELTRDYFHKHFGGLERLGARPEQVDLLASRVELVCTETLRLLAERAAGLVNATAAGGAGGGSAGSSGAGGGSSGAGSSSAFPSDCPTLSAKRARLAEGEERLVRQRRDNHKLRLDLDRSKRELAAMEALCADEERNVANGTPGEPYRDRAELIVQLHAKMRELAAVDEPVRVDQPAPPAVDQPPRAEPDVTGARIGEGIGAEIGEQIGEDMGAEIGLAAGGIDQPAVEPTAGEGGAAAEPPRAVEPTPAIEPTAGEDGQPTAGETKKSSYSVSPLHCASSLPPAHKNNASPQAYFDSLTPKERSDLYEREKAASDARRAELEQDIQVQLDAITDEEHDIVWALADQAWTPEHADTTEGFRPRLARIQRALELVRATPEPKTLIVPASAGLSGPLHHKRTVHSFADEVKPVPRVVKPEEKGEGGPQ